MAYMFKRGHTKIYKSGDKGLYGGLGLDTHSLSLANEAPKLMPENAGDKLVRMCFAAGTRDELRIFYMERISSDENKVKARAPQNNILSSKHAKEKWATAKQSGATGRVLGSEGPSLGSGAWL